MGFQFPSAWDAAWQPQVPRFCPEWVCSCHLLRQKSGSLGQSWNEAPEWLWNRSATSTELMVHLLWSHLCFSPQLGLFLPHFIRKIKLCTGHVGVGGEGLTGISTRRPTAGRSSLVHLVPGKGPGAAHYSIPSCLSLMATWNHSSSRESSLMRSVMALAKASWGL